LQLKRRDYFKRKVSDCLLIILSQNMKSVNLKGLEEKSVTRSQHRIRAKERRNTQMAWKKGNNFILHYPGCKCSSVCILSASFLLENDPWTERFTFDYMH
jgi:hypothetical protein